MTVLENNVHAITAIVISPFVGSFLSTVAARLPLGEGFVTGRSRCPRCGGALAARDLVPILSWIMLRGRCRQCGAAIGMRYPALEIAALLVAIWAAAVVEGWLVWPSCFLGWSLLTLAAIDLEHFVLPNAITLPLAAAGLVFAWLLDRGSAWQHVAGAAGMYLAFLVVAVVYRRLRGREGLGMGDAKLAAAAGAWTSWTGAPGVVLLACGAAFAFVVWRMLCGDPLGPRDRLAFGPYLCLGTWLVWLYGPLEFGAA